MAYSQTHTAMETISLTSRRPALAISLAGGILSLVGNRRGIGISWDSTDYIAVGLSMSDRKSTRLNSSHSSVSRMPSSA